MLYLQGVPGSFHNISPEGSPTLDKQKMSYAHSAYLLLVQNEGCPKFALVAELIFFSTVLKIQSC